MTFNTKVLFQIVHSGACSRQMEQKHSNKTKKFKDINQFHIGPDSQLHYATVHNDITSSDFCIDVIAKPNWTDPDYDDIDYYGDEPCHNSERKRRNLGLFYCYIPMPPVVKKCCAFDEKIDIM